MASARLDQMPKAPGGCQDIPRRARLCLRFREGDSELVCSAEYGWAILDGPWVLWWADENEDYWQSWPIHNVLCIDWHDEGHA